jgi:hypothetical protein
VCDVCDVWCGVWCVLDVCMMCVCVCVCVVCLEHEQISPCRAQTEESQGKRKSGNLFASSLQAVANIWLYVSSWPLKMMRNKTDMYVCTRSYPLIRQTFAHQPMVDPYHHCDVCIVVVLVVLAVVALAAVVVVVVVVVCGACAFVSCVACMAPTCARSFSLPQILGEHPLTHLDTEATRLMTYDLSRTCSCCKTSSECLGRAKW